MRKRIYWKQMIPSILIAFLVASSIAGGAVYAKYVADESYSGTITLQAELGTIKVQEHVADRQNDGSYKLIGVKNGKCDETSHAHLDGSEGQKGNSYVLLPGLDIPKDPTVVITKKNDIPVYVYLEVVETPASEHISYTLASCWKPVTGETNVYVYCDNTSAAVQVTDDMNISVLAEGFVEVKQNVSGTVSLSFTAVMRQCIDGQSVADIYKNTTDY